MLPPRLTTYGLLCATTAILCLTGCAGVIDLISKTGLPKPSAELVGARVEELSLRSAGLRFDVKVSNPLNVGVPLRDIDYALDADGAQILRGTANLTESIPPGGSQLVTLPLTVDLIELVRTVARLRPGQVVDYAAALTIHVDLPSTGSMGIPLRADGRFPIPSAPSAQIVSLAWHELSLSRIRGTMNLELGNTNAFPVEIQDLSYALTLGDRRIVDGTTPAVSAFAAGKSATIEIPVHASPAELGLGILQTLRGRETTYALQGVAKFRSEFGPIELSYGGDGRTTMTH